MKNLITMWRKASALLTLVGVLFASCNDISEDDSSGAGGSQQKLNGNILPVMEILRMKVRRNTVEVIQSKMLPGVLRIARENYML